MTPRPRRTPKKGDAPMVRTTLELPEDLWRAAKVKALEDRSDLRTVMMAALERYLREQAKRGK